MKVRGILAAVTVALSVLACAPPPSNSGGVVGQAQQQWPCDDGGYNGIPTTSATHDDCRTWTEDSGALKVTGDRAMYEFALGHDSTVVLIAAYNPPNHDSYKDGVPHQHNTCTMVYSTLSTCNTWILANGQVIVGPNSLISSQYNYVLVLCAIAGDGFWHVANFVYGPFNNNGQTHPYCREPAIGGIRWNLKPVGSP